MVNTNSKLDPEKQYMMRPRHADTVTVDHLIDLTKLTNRLSRALMDISLIDGSDAQTDINLARKIAREALFPEGKLPDA